MAQWRRGEGGAVQGTVVKRPFSDASPSGRRHWCVATPCPQSTACVFPSGCFVTLLERMDEEVAGRGAGIGSGLT